MNLLEFLTYCELAGLIKKRLQIDDSHCKVLIVRDNLHLEMLYGIDVFGRATIWKSALFNDDGGSRLSPSLETILEVFFSDELT